MRNADAGIKRMVQKRSRPRTAEGAGVSLCRTSFETRSLMFRGGSLNKHNLIFVLVCLLARELRPN